ncbi:hypothetical protein DNI29_11625 [Hymenobacter sediminis]|uniref:hypothetical protein n=1 Tax=Hymenobacter sediminis TaxID=2218621 RepID=UPI000DA67F3F|nr:hypothetical protein [Hymenobacter sediminis]RPD46805.1 hypothetical protein DNI29_11625 [Hymenobacter sediminis]
MDVFSASNILPAILLMAVGALIVYLARSVQRGNVEILAGYDAARVTDKAGLASWAGRSLLVLGYWQMAAGLVSFGNVSIGGTIFFLATIILVGRTVIGAQRFQR